MRDGETKQWGKTNRINRGIKEILIWSERLLIFFPLVGPCAQSLLLVLKQKSVALRVADCVFYSVYECVCCVCSIGVIYVGNSVCLYIFTKLSVGWACVWFGPSG